MRAGQVIGYHYGRAMLTWCGRSIVQIEVGGLESVQGNRQGGQVLQSEERASSNSNTVDDQRIGSATDICDGETSVLLCIDQNLTESPTGGSYAKLGLGSHRSKGNADIGPGGGSVAIACRRCILLIIIVVAGRRTGCVTEGLGRCSSRSAIVGFGQHHQVAAQINKHGRIREGEIVPAQSVKGVGAFHHQGRIGSVDIPGLSDSGGCSCVFQVDPVGHRIAVLGLYIPLHAGYAADNAVELIFRIDHGVTFITVG